jgi:hypothetical protein
MSVVSSIPEVTQWLGKATTKLEGFIKGGDAVNAVALTVDIQAVVTSYLNVTKSFIPSATTPFPKNMLSRLSWVLRNASWLTIITTLICGVNPFTEAKMEATAVAAKWGF